jgi:nuclear transport factor 2 (NTF2) superfamily protein
VKNGYTSDSIWRNRDTFLRGTDEIVAFLTKKWEKENGYRLRKELFAFTDNKVSCFLLFLFVFEGEMWCALEGAGERTMREFGNAELTRRYRSLCNSGMNGTTIPVNGGELMVSKIGPMQKMVE